MKVSELTGAKLDYWVAKALGAEDATLEDWGDGEQICITAYNAFERVPFRPSSNWSDGGPIIERDGIDLQFIPSGEINKDPPFWCGGLWSKEKIRICPESGSPTLERYCDYDGSPLIAAMRAYVASKFGEEVPDDVA